MSQKRKLRRLLQFGSSSQEDLDNDKCLLSKGDTHLSEKINAIPVVKQDSSVQPKSPCCDWGMDLSENEELYYRLRKRVDRPCVVPIDCSSCEMSQPTRKGFKPFSGCSRVQFVRWETIDEYNARRKPSIQRYLDIETS